MKLIVEFEWDEKEWNWFDIDTLKLCLFTEEFAKREWLKVKEREQDDKWDKKSMMVIKQEIEKLFEENEVEELPMGVDCWSYDKDRIIEGLLSLIQKDHKHQKAELLKRLPSVEEIRARLFIPFGNYKAWRKDEISKAIHDLIEEKLEGKKHAEKCPLYNEEGLSNEEEEENNGGF